MLLGYGQSFEVEKVVCVDGQKLSVELFEKINKQKTERKRDRKFILPKIFSRRCNFGDNSRKNMRIQKMFLRVTLNNKGKS